MRWRTNPLAADRAVRARLCGRTSLFVAVLALTLAPAVRAAEPVTLESLVADTVARNPEVRFYEAEIEAARGGRMTAGTWANPALSSELGHKRVRNLDGHNIGDGAIWLVSLSQTFEFPGRLSLRKAIANRQIQMAELGLRQFRAALAMRARALGYQLLAAHQRADAAGEVSKRFQDLRAVLVQRDIAGVTPLLETRIVEASAFTLSRRSSEATIAAGNAQFELNQLRGLPISTPIAIARTPLPLTPAPALEALLDTAREQNFEIRTRIAELEQQGLRVTLSRNERWPAVTIAPFVTNEKGSDRELRYGLGVTVPLPVLDQNTGNIETAKARETQAQVALTVAWREVERKIAAARNAYETFLTEMATWPPDAVQTFREAAHLGDEHYRLGALPIATYTELQKQYLDAVDALLHTQADALEARQQLELLTGLSLTGAPAVSIDTGTKTPRRRAPARGARARK